MSTHTDRLPLRERNERIFLTGFMGSGKSTIGPILANSLGFNFVDLDRWIEAEEHVSVNAIFKNRGESAFRALEEHALRALCAKPGHVVALGGGTLTAEENVRLILSSGILIYLKSNPDQLLQRLRHRTDRPMLCGTDGRPLDEAGLRERIALLHAQREPVYALADLTVQTDGSRLGMTVDQLVRKLRPFLR